MRGEATWVLGCLYFWVGAGWEMVGICDFLSSVHVIDGRILICKRAREFWSHYTYRHGRQSVTCFGGEFWGVRKIGGVLREAIVPEVLSSAYRMALGAVW